MKNIVAKIEANLVYEVMDKTALEVAPLLSQRLGNTIYFKREDQTPVHSFKLRGAYHKMRKLTKTQLAKGIITSSAGNHAQGVALSAQKLGAEAIIVMPKTTSTIKVEAVKNFGGKVELHGNNYDEARDFAENIAKKTGATFIHPFDDPDVIAGQATIGVELLEQLSKIDYIFIPVGGGGLISGVAAVIKTHSPNTKIIAVEPTESSALSRSMAAGKQVVLEQVGLFADGVAVHKIGDAAFRLSPDLVDEAILVSNDEICAAIKDIYNETRSIVETSGALSVAGAKRYIDDFGLRGQNIITILSGANLNFDRLRFIAERADLGEQKEAIIAVTIKEEIGSFLNFCKLLGQSVITEFNYRYGDSDKARIFVGVALTDGEAEKIAIIARLKKDFKVLDMSDNSMAKTHIRYMVGGHSRAENEVIYRFEFPEYPGALLNFLQKIGNNWNISLFHYRNHGADFGRILIGLQASDTDILEQSFDELGYFYQNETDNPAYRYFL